MKTTWKSILGTDLSSGRRTARILLAAGVLCGLMIIFFVQPADLPFGSCAFYSMTGHSCFTCGMTRSLHSISHGNLAASLRYHLFGPALFAGMVLFFMILTAEAVVGEKLVICTNRRMKNRAFVLVAAAWIVYWGFRLASECVA